MLGESRKQFGHCFLASSKIHSIFKNGERLALMAIRLAAAAQAWFCRHATLELDLRVYDGRENDKMFAFTLRALARTLVDLYRVGLLQRNG
jgi:hypothetical protein